MVWKTPVDGVENVGRNVAEDFPGKKAGHSVGEVKGYVEIAVVALVLHHEIDVVLVDVFLMHLSPLLRHRGRTAFVNPGLDLAEPGVQAYGKGILAADLHTVVFGRIMAGSDLHGGLETVVGSSEIYHWRAAQAYVKDVGAGIAYSFQKTVVNLFRRNPAVASDEDFLRSEEFRDEIAHFVGSVFIEIHSVDSADIISVKCSHTI